MKNKILQTIKEWEKEFDKKIGKLPNGNDFLVEEVRTKDNFCISCGHPANPNKAIENIKSHIASQNKKLIEAIVDYLNEKKIGKGEDENFDDGAYYENREIELFLTNILKEL